MKNMKKEQNEVSAKDEHGNLPKSVQVIFGHFVSKIVIEPNCVSLNIKPYFL